MKIAFLIVSIVLLIILINQLTTLNNIEKVNILSTDGKKISGNFYSVPAPKGWLILIHMMPATKESWDSFAKSMQELGYASLAIDLRGHGESTGGPDGYKNFTDIQHQASIYDLDAGWSFLKLRRAIPEKTALIGASIGANLALEFIAERNIGVGKAVLLSAGTDYRGIKTEPLVKKLKNGQSVIFVTSKDDDDNAKENRILYDLAPKNINKHLITYDNGGHGTDILQATEYNLPASILKFLENGSIN